MPAYDGMEIHSDVHKRILRNDDWGGVLAILGVFRGAARSDSDQERSLNGLRCWVHHLRCEGPSGKPASVRR